MTRADFITYYANFCLEQFQTFNTLGALVSDEIREPIFEAYQRIIHTSLKLQPFEISFFNDITNIEEFTDSITWFLEACPNYLTEEWQLDKSSILKNFATLDCYYINTICPQYQDYYTDNLLDLIFQPCENFRNRLLSEKDREFLSNIESYYDFNINNIFQEIEKYCS